MILKNYINREIYRATAAILLVLILIFITSRFVKYIQLAVDGTISAKAVFELIGLQIPTVAGFLIPLSFFLAILLSFGRMYSENELVVVHGLGIGQKDLARMLLPAALVLSFIAGSLSAFLTPWAITQSRQLMAEQAAQAKLGIFSAGRFRENSSKDGIVFVEAKSKSGVMSGVFAVSRFKNKIKDTNDASLSDGEALTAQNNETEKLKIQTATSGRQWEDQKTGVNFVVLENGQYSEYDENIESWRITDFESTYTRIKQGESIQAKNSVKSTSIFGLFRKLGNKEWAEIHWRLVAPISVPLIFLLAIPLSRIGPRQGKFGRILPSLLIYLIYILLMMYSRKLIETGKIPALAGFWWIHLGMAFYVYYLYIPAKIKSNKNLKFGKQDV